MEEVNFMITRLSMTCCCSFTKLCPILGNPWTVAHQAPLSFTISQSLSNSCPLIRWCYLTISSSAAYFPFCLQSFSATGSFPKSWLFASDGQSIGASTSASVQFSPSVGSNSFRPHGLQHTRPPCPSPITEVYSNSCPLSLSSPSPLAFNRSQHQGLFKWVSSSHQVAKLLEFQLQHQSFQWIFRADFL